MIHAKDDKSVPIENSVHYLEALKEARVPCEFVELRSGGPGLGLGAKGGDPAKWPPRCLGWLQVQTAPKE